MERNSPVRTNGLEISESIHAMFSLVYQTGKSDEGLSSNARIAVPPSPSPLAKEK